MARAVLKTSPIDRLLCSTLFEVEASYGVGSPGHGSTFLAVFNIRIFVAFPHYTFALSSCKIGSVARWDAVRQAVDGGVAHVEIVHVAQGLRGGDPDLAGTNYPDINGSEQHPPLRKLRAPRRPPTPNPQNSMANILTTIPTPQPS